MGVHVRVSLRRPPRGPGVRTQTVDVALPMSGPTTRSRSLTVSEVQALADALPGRYGALVQVLAFGGLRFGGRLRCAAVPCWAAIGCAWSARSVTSMVGGWSANRRRTPDGVSACQHGERSGRPSRPVGPSGDDVWPANGSAARVATHAGATLVAATGAMANGLTRRMGHSSPDAALTCQHAVDEGDGEIARARRHARRSLGHTEVMDGDAGASAWPCTAIIPSGCSFPS